MCALAIVASALASCDATTTQAERARNVVDAWQYREELTRCRAEGADAGSYAVYERCAREVDRHVGFDAGAPR